MKIKALRSASNIAGLLGALLCATQSTIAQTVPLAGSPAEYWQGIERKLGIPQWAGKPWHLVLSVKIFNEESPTETSGIFEEFFADEHHLYRIISLGTQEMHWWETPAGASRSGTIGLEINTFSLVRRGLVATGMPANYVTGQYLQVDQPGSRDDSLTCISIADGHPEVPEWARLVDCYDGTTLKHSQYTPAKADFYFDNWTAFNGSQVAQDLVIKRDGHLIASAHIEKLEDLSDADRAQLLPGKDAEPINPFSSPSRRFGVAGVLAPRPPNQIGISAGVAQGMLVNHTAPLYPAVAKAAGVAGTVVLQATMSKTGTIESLRVVSGPAMLQQAALDAVRSWTYRPYLLNGEPIEVNTTINVVFTLGQSSKIVSNSSGSAAGDARP